MIFVLILVLVPLIFIEYSLMQESWVSGARNQRGVARLRGWEQRVPVKWRQTHRSRSSRMVHKLRECESKLEEADSRIRNMTLSGSSATNPTGPTNRIPLENLLVVFTETVKGRGCTEGEIASIEVQCSDGSRMIWSCNRSEH